MSELCDLSVTCATLILSGALRRLIEAEGEKVTGEQPWKLVTFCVQSAQDAADVSKRNKGEPNRRLPARSIRFQGHFLRLPMQQPVPLQ